MITSTLDLYVGIHSAALIVIRYVQRAPPKGYLMKLPKPRAILGRVRRMVTRDPDRFLRQV